MYLDAIRVDSFQQAMTHMKLRQQIQQFKVPHGKIALWWVGQSGWILKSPKNKIVVINPYLTNACKAVGAINEINMDRLFPPPLQPKDLLGVVAYTSLLMATKTISTRKRFCRIVLPTNAVPLSLHRKRATNFASLVCSIPKSK